jgi:hypothetical protein
MNNIYKIRDYPAQMTQPRTQRVLNPWFYDTVLEDIVTRIKKNTDKLQKYKERQDCTGVQEEIRQLLIEQVQEIIVDYKKGVDELKQSKIVLVGPATIDSLVNQKPERYDYIENKQLPFDKLFFELPVPFKLNYPFKPEERDCRGIYFYVLDNEKSDSGLNYGTYSYGIDVFYRDSERDFVPVTMVCNPAKKDRFTGTLTDMRFDIDLTTKTVEYISVDDEEKFVRANLDPLQRIRTMAGPINISHKIPLDEAKNHEVFVQLANLCTNLINYINGHNVTFVERNREVAILQRNERNKKKKIIEQKPFYLVTIEDAVKEHQEVISDEDRSLKWRIYVRGHNRHYRDEHGRIYLVTWIAPYIKGPENAPRREDRYILLADKLLKEKEMMRKYL